MSPQAAPHRPGPDAGDWELRLHRAAIGTEAAREVYQDEIEARDAAIIDAIDAGVSIAKVARWAHLSPGRVIAILARPA